MLTNKDTLRTIAEFINKLSEDQKELFFSMITEAKIKGKSSINKKDSWLVDQIKKDIALYDSLPDWLKHSNRGK